MNYVGAPSGPLEVWARPTCFLKKKNPVFFLVLNIFQIVLFMVGSHAFHIRMRLMLARISFELVSTLLGQTRPIKDKLKDF